jgi:hypothetical protein
MRTATGYDIEVRRVSPFIFVDLRLKHQVEREFVYQVTVLETGATLSFAYALPEDGEPSPDDKEAFSLYWRFRAWKAAQEERVALYQMDRDNLLLGMAVKIVTGPDGLDWQADMAEREWQDDLLAGGITITPHNLRLLYLKSKVLTEEKDLTMALDFATTEEVTLGDIHVAYERFRYVLARYVAIHGGGLPPEWKDPNKPPVLGGADSVPDGHHVGAVV